MKHATDAIDTIDVDDDMANEKGNGAPIPYEVLCSPSSTYSTGNLGPTTPKTWAQLASESILSSSSDPGSEVDFFDITPPSQGSPLNKHETSDLGMQIIIPDKESQMLGENQLFTCNLNRKLKRAIRRGKPCYKNKKRRPRRLVKYITQLARYNKAIAL